jgi:hypothetical protein
MTKAHARADLEQAGLGWCRGGVRGDTEPLGGAPNEQRVAHGIGRREQQ